MAIKVCQHCRKPYTAINHNQKWCSELCSWDFNAGPRPEDPDQCWVWRGRRNKDGYGNWGWLNKPGETTRAHIISYRKYKGPVPEGMILLHKCPNGHNPGCINPNHLIPGTHKENTHDRRGQGTACLGEQNPFRKLTEQQVKEIYLSNESYEKLGGKYGVTGANIRHIKSGKSWSWLTKSL